jgi:hypothetical protein
VRRESLHNRERKPWEERASDACDADCYKTVGGVKFESGAGIDLGNFC